MGEVTDLVTADMLQPIIDTLPANIPVILPEYSTIMSMITINYLTINYLKNKNRGLLNESINSK